MPPLGTDRIPAVSGAAGLGVNSNFIAFALAAGMAAALIALAWRLTGRRGTNATSVLAH